MNSRTLLGAVAAVLLGLGSISIADHHEAKDINGQALKLENLDEASKKELDKAKQEAKKQQQEAEAKAKAEIEAKKKDLRSE